MCTVSIISLFSFKGSYCLEAWQWSKEAKLGRMKHPLTKLLETPFLSTFSTNILKDWSILFLHQSFNNTLLHFFWWSPFYSYLTKYCQFHKYRMIINAQEEPLVNGKQVILCAMNFSWARSPDFGKNIDSMNVFLWGLAYHDVYMCRQHLTPFQCNAEFQSTMSSSH